MHPLEKLITYSLIGAFVITAPIWVPLSFIGYIFHQTLIKLGAK